MTYLKQVEPFLVDKNMITDKLNSVWKELSEDSKKNPPTELGSGVPTLQNNMFRQFSPQLKERFEEIGSWLDSTHGDWLNLDEMKIFWDQKNYDDRMLKIFKNIISSIENWQDDAGAIFKPERVSVFAGSANTYERVYLIWFDSVVEPEVWVYDINGEQRFKDLDTYLKAYLDDDLSYIDIKWKLGQLS